MDENHEDTSIFLLNSSRSSSACSNSSLSSLSSIHINYTNHNNERIDISEDSIESFSHFNYFIDEENTQWTPESMLNETIRFLDEHYPDHGIIMNQIKIHQNSGNIDVQLLSTISNKCLDIMIFKQQISDSSTNILRESHLPNEAMHANNGYHIVWTSNHENYTETYHDYDFPDFLIEILT
jgi:hypothetical protein